MDPPALHPEIAHLGFLVGTWRGAGSGDYPTIEAFEFTEETEFTHVGKPFLAFVQRTRDVHGVPLHTESGYLRPAGRDAVEFLITMPSGLVESLGGTVSGTTLELTSSTVLRTSTAKEVNATRRRYVVEGDTMRWTFAMAAVGHPMTHHLAGELHRS